MIRQEIEQTRAALNNKLSSLEYEVKETYLEAREEVEERVDAVKKQFDMSYQMDQRPLAFVGAAVVTGIFAGKFLFSRAPQLGHFAQTAASTSNRLLLNGAPKPGLVSKFADHFGDELSQVKGLAVGMALGYARDFITQNLSPELKGKVDNIVADATRKMGGTPINNGRAA